MKKLLLLLIMPFAYTTIRSSDVDEKIKIKTKTKSLSLELSLFDEVDDITTKISKNSIDDTKKVNTTAVKKPLKTKKTTFKFPLVYFSPGIQDTLIKFINDEQQGLQGAWYEFTLYKAAEAIVKGIKERHITTSLIVNHEYEKNFCSPLQLILNNGGSLYTKDKNKKRNGNNTGYFEHMHHKFMIFHKNVANKKLLWTGSFNVTGQANLKNDENAIIIDDIEAIEKFEQEFAEVLEHSTAILSIDDTAAKEKTASIDAFNMNNIPVPDNYTPAPKTTSKKFIPQKYTPKKKSSYNKYK